MNELLDTKQAAKALGLKPHTLNCWRTNGGRLPFVRVGSRAVRYRRSDLEAFVTAGVCHSTSDQGAASGSVRPGEAATCHYKL